MNPHRRLKFRGRFDDGRPVALAPEIARSSFLLANGGEKHGLRMQLVEAVKRALPMIHRTSFINAVEGGLVPDEHLAEIHREATGKKRFGEWLPNQQITSGEFVRILRKRLNLYS